MAARTFAKESKDINEIFKSIKDVIKTCLQEESNIDEWPMFDLEYIFLMLRSLSVNSIEDFKVATDLFYIDLPAFVNIEKGQTMYFDKQTKTPKK